jgi:hypothetical protein
MAQGSPTLEKEQRTKNLLWTLGELQYSRLYYERRGGRGGDFQIVIIKS